jgi:hypothetical protein
MKTAELMFVDQIDLTPYSERRLTVVGLDYDYDRGGISVDICWDEGTEVRFNGSVVRSPETLARLYLQPWCRHGVWCRYKRSTSPDGPRYPLVEFFTDQFAEAEGLE